jgi:hypothetical protein
MTTAMADQLVLTLKAQPSQQLMDELMASLRKLNALPLLGAAGTPQAVAAQVQAVQDQIVAELTSSGLLVTPSPSASASSQAVATASATPTSTDSSQPVTSSTSTDSATPTDTPSPSATATTSQPSPSATASADASESASP